MKLTWQIEEQDVQKVQTLIVKWADDSLVQLRKSRNIDKQHPILSEDTVWFVLVACLLTTQQRSGPGSAVKRLLDQQPFPLSYAVCKDQKKLRGFIEGALTSFGGIRRASTIAKQCVANLKMLKGGLWNPLLEKLRKVNESDDSTLEREVAHYVAEQFHGFGPKQSRNLLQWLGTSKHEIPIDSRIMKWLNTNLLDFHLSAQLLSDPAYYDLLTDGIQALCKRANLFPCMFDATVFTSFDKGWDEDDLGASETLGQL